LKRLAEKNSIRRQLYLVNAESTPQRRALQHQTHCHELFTHYSPLDRQFATDTLGARPKLGSEAAKSTLHTAARVTERRASVQ
jgi:hypothetical protein